MRLFPTAPSICRIICTMHEAFDGGYTLAGFCILTPDTIKNRPHKPGLFVECESMQYQPNLTPVSRGIVHSPDL